jgi:hypothetical protein
MDFPPPPPSLCTVCGDECVSITTVCGPCHVRASVAFWAFIEGTGSKLDFYDALKPPHRLSDGPVFPVAGESITCGKRADVPKLNRRHLRVSLGMDTRNLGELGFWDVEIFACVRCGQDSKGSSSDENAVSRME